jgi:hypothetical protein
MVKTKGGVEGSTVEGRKEGVKREERRVKNKEMLL